jgi:PleD family two-component response regulator
VTASFGVTSFAAGDDAYTLVKRADEALYLAKTQGRNRVECRSAGVL